MFQGRKCTETKSEQSPWWTVDLLSVQVKKSNNQILNILVYPIKVFELPVAVLVIIILQKGEFVSDLDCGS